MYRAIFARCGDPRLVLVLHGTITVMAAFAWRLGFDPATGFVVSMFNLDTPPLTTRGSVSFVVIIFAEDVEDDALHRLALLEVSACVPEDLYKAARNEQGIELAALRLDHTADDRPS